MAVGNRSSKVANPENAAARTRFPGTRYGDSADIAHAVGAFVGLFLLAAYVIIDSSPLMSTCFDATGQTACPISGPDWARPLPGAATLMGLLIGLAGLAVGRPVRAGALIAGFALTTAALITNWVVG